MNYERIKNVINIAAMGQARVCVVGTGGAALLCRNLVRCGVRTIDLLDRDVVEDVNVCRQEHPADQIGMTKVAALAAELKRIDPSVGVRTHYRDITAVTDDEADALFGGVGRVTLFVAATDSHPAQARVNELALRFGSAAVFIGVYEGGVAGEVFFWHSGLASCYRCMCGTRYEAQEQKAFDPPSQGATVLDVTLVDSLAGMIAVGLLTRGSDNRYGRLIDRLGDRNFLQVKIDPDFGWEGEDFFARELGIPAGTDAYFGCVAIARRNPDPGGDCPDCVRYRLRGIRALPYSTWH